MKQFIVLDHFLKKKDIVMTDVTPKVFDCVVMQKTTITFASKINISEEDVCLIRDASTREVEYIGIVDTIDRGTTTKVAILPFMAICDNDCKVSVLDGNVQTWIEEQITNNFITTNDIYNAYPITIRDNTSEAVTYKIANESDNLLDCLNNIYLNTGIYIDFSVQFEDGKVNGLYCDIYNANEQEVKKIRYDNPQIVDKVSYKFSQYGNYTKCTIQVGDTEQRFELYLQEDNRVTTKPDSPTRIKKVKNKNVKLTADFSSQDELAEAVALLAQSTLCGDAFAYSIEFNILRKAIEGWKFRQRCDFLAEDRLYQSYITNIEYLNDKEAHVTLGAYRYTLTDKFKQLSKVREVDGSLSGVTISTAFGSTIYWFSQNEDGDLLLNYEGDNAPAFSLNEDGELLYTYNNEEPDLNVDNSGELTYTF